ncbi:MAG: D-glycerate dehydrogenase [Patescibacteria group bacterium]
MKKVFITRQIPEVGIKMLTDKGYQVTVSSKDRPLSKKEIIKALKKDSYDAVLTLLTDPIDKEVLEAAPTVKIFANYAIGFNNIDVEEAKKRGIFVTNTPGGGADRVAEHTWALILALTCRVVEADLYMRKGKFNGWNPMIFHGTKLAGKMLGIIGTGRIGADVAHRAVNGFGMKIAYYDVKRNDDLEKNYQAVFCATPEEVLRQADVVSIHVPLLPSTHHLINANRLPLMKKTAYLINTSRGQVVDEVALVDALKAGAIAGAGLDVFEFEPKLAKGLAKLSNVVLTPHIASGTAEARHEMAVLSAQNIIDTLEGGRPTNLVY